MDVAVKPKLEDYTTDADTVLAPAIDVIDGKSRSSKLEAKTPPR